MNKAERINTPGHKEVNELDYELLEAERKVDAFFYDKILRRRVSLHMSSRGMRGEHVLNTFESKLRTNGRTNERMNDGL